MNKRPDPMVHNKSRIPIGYADSPVEIHLNNFVHKSLSNFSCNVAVGCGHGCRFCYVPEVATIKQKRNLAIFGVADPDAEWGQYVLLRPWDEKRFLKSLMVAENIPREQLKPASLIPTLRNNRARWRRKPFSEGPRGSRG